MTYEEMIIKIKENVDVYIGGLERTSDRQWKVTGEEFIEAEWVSGGITGNSCYGRSPRAVESNEPEELKRLEAILTLLCPQITYLQFRKIEDKVEIGTRSDGGDFYGNYYEYTYKVLKMKDLYDVLEGLGLI
jgi:hypothetical protein